MGIIYYDMLHRWDFISYSDPDNLLKMMPINAAVSHTDCCCKKGHKILFMKQLVLFFGPVAMTTAQCVFCSVSSVRVDEGPVFLLYGCDVCACVPVW